MVVFFVGLFCLIVLCLFSYCCDLFYLFIVCLRFVLRVCVLVVFCGILL